MIATYLNRYEDSSVIYFDLSFEEETNQLLRLGSVPFDIGYTEQDMIDKAMEIFGGNFSSEEYQLTEIITK